MRRVFVLAAILAANITAFGAVNVTASRDYVDRKVEAVSNTLTRAIQDAEPGNYNTVSNKAMTAIQSLQPATNYADTAVGNLRTDLTTGTTTVKKASTLVTEGGVQKTAEQIISGISERTSTNDVRGIVTARSESGYTDWVISSDHEYFIQRIGYMKVLPWSQKWNLYKGNLYGSDKMAGAQGNRDSTNLSWSVAFAPGEYATVSATRSPLSTNTLSLATYDDIDKVPSMSVARAETYGTKYRWTDSTGCVWQVSSDVWKDYWEITPKDRASGMCVFWDGDSWVFQYEGFTQDTGIGSSVGSFNVDALGVQCRRYPGGDTVLVTRIASTNDVESIAIDLARNKSLVWVSDMGILKCSHDCAWWVGDLIVNGNPISAKLQSNVDFFWMFLTYNGTRLRYDGGGTVSDETITLSNPWNEDAGDYADSYPFQSVTFKRRESNGLGLPDFEDLDTKQNLLPYPTNQIPYSAIYNPPWLTSFTESDPTIYSWAKASTKPSYSWSEITSKPSFKTVATSGAYSDLTGRPDLDNYLEVADFYGWQTNVNIVIGKDNEWDESKTGQILIGHDSVVTGKSAMAVGPYAIANGDYAMAFGTSEAMEDYAVALGFNNFSLASEAFSAGLFSQAFFSWGSAVGYKAVSSNNYASAFGAFAEATGPQALALGPAKATELNAISIGTFAEASATNTIAIGPGAKAKAYLGIAIGTLAEAEENGLAIGYDSYAGPGSVALGMGRRPTSIFGIYGSQAFGTRTYALGGYVASNVVDSVSIGTYAWNTNSNAVVISAGHNTINGPETRSHGDGTITLGVTNGLHDVWIGTNTLDEAISRDYAKKSESLSPSTLTNTVRSVVSVTSSYIWDAQAECLYRRDMKAGYLYWTPVTNVNALLPENISVLNYLEEHKND